MERVGVVLGVVFETARVPFSNNRNDVPKGYTTSLIIPADGTALVKVAVDCKVFFARTCKM